MSTARCNGMRYGGGLIQRVQNVDFLPVDSNVGSGFRRRQLQGLQASFLPTHKCAGCVGTQPAQGLEDHLGLKTRVECLSLAFFPSMDTRRLSCRSLHLICTSVRALA